MSSDNDNPRRDRDRPEDNPFIAFRRFADSQVSSLLNTVFTLPATLANYNNAYHAREQCLFGQADKDTCKKLLETEKKINAIRSEGRELFRVGDVQAVLEKGEELMRLDREADVLRKEVIGQTRAGEPRPRGSWEAAFEDGSKKDAALVEKVANQKGQEWGWSWSWGFPKPFDAQDDQSFEETCHDRRARWRQRRAEMQKRRAENQERWDRWKNIKGNMAEELPRDEEHTSQDQPQDVPSEYSGPKVWHWSFSWPPTADNQKDGNTTSDRQKDIFDEFSGMTVNDIQRMLLGSSFHADQYHPHQLEQDEELKKSGIDWSKAFEDLRLEEQRQAFLANQKAFLRARQQFWDAETTSREDQRQQPSGYPKLVPWESEEASEEPSYEYEHDHEDQHDDPPMSKLKQGKFDEPSTELEVYERFLAPKAGAAEPMDDTRPSLLSTLTTTERTVAPDGTVTTKVVLKKRFTDGREESSETLHTQRSQDEDANAHKADPWKANDTRILAKENAADQREHQNVEKEKRKSGWFWSN
jgi:hypothetical protein